MSASVVTESSWLLALHLPKWLSCGTANGPDEVIIDAIVSLALAAAITSG